MSTCFIICLVCCGLSSAIAQTTEYNVTDAGDLEDALLNRYKTTCRPAKKTNVYFSFGLTSINSLNIVDQQLSLNGFLLIAWNDFRLAFDPSSYGKMSYTFMKSNQIWVPPVVLNNAADGVKILSDDGDLTSIPLIVTSSGEVYWLAPCNYVAQCSVNIQYYPFDSQSCDLLVSSWMYQSHELDVLAMRGITTVNTEMYEIHGEWDVTGSSVETTVRTLLRFPLPAMKFTINLKRKYSYYLVNMILPVVFLALLGAIVFLLPVESGEKNGFALTILLSLSVVMTIVSDSIPPTSTHICVLSVYLLVTFMVCAMEVLLTVVTIRIYNLEDLGYAPSSTLQRFMKKFLSKVSLYARAKDIKAYDLDDVDAESMTNDTNNKGESRMQGSKSPIAWGDDKNEKSADSDVDDYSYKDLSIMMDRINFVIFLGFTVIITLVFMLTLTYGDS